MGCDLSKVYNIEIHLENELAVFEPRDEVAGHVLIRAEEDTAIHSCVIWLYGFVKTCWTIESKSSFTETGSVSVGLNRVRSTATLNGQSDRRNLENLCETTASFFTQVSESIRNVSRDWSKDSMCTRPVKRHCHPEPDCPWDMRPPVEQAAPASATYFRDPLARNTERSSSYNSVADTLIASFERRSCSQHSSSTSKISYINADAALAAQIKANRFSLLTCRSCDSCDSCASRFADQKCPILQNNDSAKKKNISFGDVRIIYRAKVNLLKHYNSPVRQNIRAEASPSSDGSFSNSQEEIRSDATNANGLAADGTDNQNAEFGLAAAPDTEINVLKKSSSSAAFLLTRGTHIFDFEFKLPADLPSSFELPTSCLAGGAAARLCYGLRIEIRNYTAKIRHTQHREIIIFRPLELTHFPRLRDRVTLHKEFVLSGCCASPNGLILCDLTVNKTGFVPGESIIPQICVVNRSTRAIHTVHLTFAQTILLRGRREQRHVEVLRLFASRLKPRQTAGADNLTSRLIDRSLEENPSLFSPSVSPSSHTSPSKSDRSRPAPLMDKIGISGKSNGEVRRASVGNLAAVQPNGASAYFEDIIHVPPLPATGLFGRQSLIQVEYMLILRLRMEGDVEGKHEQRMQIPITVGSDPTRETSFIGSSEVVPCYASFNYASGEVTEYDPSTQGLPSQASRHLRPVYRYFKPRPTVPTATSADTVQQQTGSSRSSLVRSDTKIPTNVSSSGTVQNLIDNSVCTAHNKQVSRGSHGSTTMATASGAKPSARFISSASMINETGVGLGLCTDETNVQTTEDSASSDSPSLPILSRQQFFDNGDRVILNGNKQELSRELSTGPHLPAETNKLIPKNLICDEVRLKMWSRSAQLHRRYSFELCSDRTPSGDDDSVSENDSDEEDANLLDEANFTYVRSTPESSSASEPEDPANFHLCDDTVQTESHNYTTGNKYSPQHSTHSGPSILRKLISSSPSSQVNTASQFESVSFVRDTRKNGYMQAQSSMPESISGRRPSGRDLHNAYWSCPKVAPVPGRRMEQDQFWTAGKSSKEIVERSREPIEISLRPESKLHKTSALDDIGCISQSNRNSSTSEDDTTIRMSDFQQDGHQGYMAKGHRSTLVG